MSKKADQFDEKEAQRRFEAALKGARVTGHKQKRDIKTDKKPKATKKKPR